MTLEEAISHALEVAEQNETQADKIGRQFIGSAMDKRATDCRECAADHRQLAEWLTELKELRNSLGAVKLSNMKEALELIRDYKTENITQKKLIAEYKRLLKAAVEDFSYCSGIYRLYYYNIGRDECVARNNTPCYEFRWRYANEVLRLIGEDGDTNGRT